MNATGVGSGGITANQNEMHPQGTAAQTQGSQDVAPQPGQTHQNQQQHLPPHQRHGQGFHIEGFGPDGQRFQIHQQTMYFPPMQMPGAPQMGMPMMPGQHMQPIAATPFPPPGFPQGGMPPAPLAPPQFPDRGPSALDRARENMAEMRRMLDEIASQNDGTDEQGRQRIEEAQNRARRVNEYIDPLNLGFANTTGGSVGGGGGGGGGGRRSTSPRPPQSSAPMQNGASSATHPPGMSRSQPPVTHIRAPGMPWQEIQRPSHPDDVAVYFLSSPRGPEAILFSPQHGTHIGTHIAPTTSNRSTRQAQQQGDGQRVDLYPHTQPTPQQQAQPAQPQAQAAGAPDPVAQAAQQHLADGQNAQAAQQAANGGIQDPLALQAILNHFWMLFRILIFAYFLLGANLGWQRPVILMAVGAGFWVVRMGVLGQGGAVRRWWDGVVGVPGRQAQAQVVNGGERRDGGAGQVARPEEVGRQANQGGNADGNGRQRMPAPEQVAQRLLNEAEGRNQQRRNWLREQIRPVERAVALFVASLWPGIGEAHVREQRRLQQEEEVARRRAAEEEAQRQREREGEKKDDDAEGGKGGGSGEMNESATGQSSSTGNAAATLGSTVVREGESEKAAGASN